MGNDLAHFMSQFLYGLIRSNESRLAASLRGKWFRTRCFIDTGVHIANKKNFQAGQGCALYHGSCILNTHGRFSMKRNSHLGAYCYVNVCHGKVEIGEDVAIGPGTKIIAYSNHYRKGKKVTEERITADISIGNNVLIGANCTILPGTKISDNVIVAAGAVVKGMLEANNIYGGITAKIITSGWYV